MPVTATLSQKFYQKFGDDLTNELVAWLNQVDATYRSDLRELNELNFARFDARLEQRAAQIEAKVDQRMARLEATMDQRMGQVELRIAQLEGKLDGALARLEGGLLARIGMVEGRLARLTLIFWVATLGTLVAVLKL